MATPEEISYALQLIDAYIDQIQDWEATGKYDQHSKEFFVFLKEYNANPGAIINIIKDATGLAPNQIRNRGDAEAIRELLRRTMASEILGKRISPKDIGKPGKWAKENVRFAFEQRDIDPIEKPDDFN